MIYDHMMLDGLEDAYDKGRAMGTFGEDCAEKYGFTREAQDHFAMTSVRRAQEATETGAFRWEIAPVTVSGKTGDTLIDTDEGPRRIKVDKIPSLKPAFKKDGTVTAASSSSINDGAAALVMMRESTAKQLGITPLAVMLGHTTHAQAPGWFTTAPVTAIDKLFKKLDWNAGNVDLFEINEAFAVVPMAAMHDLHIPHEKVNVNGGACALGHPIGASGARLMATLIGALRHRGGKRGVASLCIGGGEATAVGIELY
jgi:acetyl-CoA C-acetyltransferase